MGNIALLQTALCRQKFNVYHLQKATWQKTSFFYTPPYLVTFFCRTYCFFTPFRSDKIMHQNYFMVPIPKQELSKIDKSNEIYILKPIFASPNPLAYSLLLFGAKYESDKPTIRAATSPPTCVWTPTCGSRDARLSDPDIVYFVR